MIHLRIIAPGDRAPAVLEVLDAAEAVIDIVHAPGVARRPDGDVITCEVAREDASVVIGRLRGLDLERDGAILVFEVATHLSRAGDEAVRRARGDPTDAVVWELVEARTADSARPSATFMAFMALAALVAAVAIMLDNPILLVGAMVIGPEFGPLAGLCVALVTRRLGLAARSALAMALGLPLAVLAALGLTAALRALGEFPDTLDLGGNAVANLISSPDVLALVIALVAGVAGMLSLSTAKSSALVGVLISVTTIPAAAGIGVGLAYARFGVAGGALAQLAVNLGALAVAGTITLAAQRALYDRRRTREAPRSRGARRPAP